jgi:hypothetical protein
MKLKLKLITIASATALVAGVGVTFATPALANNEVFMCVEPYPGASGGIGCAFDGEPNAPLSPVFMDPSNLITLWNAPTTGGKYGQISYYRDGGSGPSSRCMEVDAGIKVGESDGIRLAPCDGKPSEEWLPVQGTDSEGYTYWEYISQYDTNLCLNSNPYANQTSAAPCNDGTNEQWLLANEFGTPES